MSEVLQAEIEALAEVVRGARRLLFITGAGLSADSGLPTYRGIGGLYEDVQTDHGMPIEVALSGGMFLRDPAIPWHYIAQIERGVRGASFNAAHRVIAGLERSHEVVVLTQNVDGLHVAAGSSDVIDIHGDCHDLCCTACDYRKHVRDYAALEVPPRCPSCGAVVRPDVVLFGEMLPSDKLSRLYDELGRGFDVTFSVGTTSVFPYIALPIEDALRRGRPSVEINPGETQVSRLVTHKLACGAAVALSALERALQ